MSSSPATVASPPTGHLAGRFNRAMLELYQRSRRQLGYNAGHLLRMITDEGGVATARRLLMADRPSEGFSYLWEHQRLDLAVEALVIDPAFAPRFDEEVLARAERRLLDFGHRP